MRRNEKLTYLSGASSVVFATNKNSSPYWWNNADGLDGLDNNIFSIKGSGQDGETLTGQNLQARVITVDGQMLKDANARQRLIRAVIPKAQVNWCIPTDKSPAGFHARFAKHPQSQETALFQRFKLNFIALIRFGERATAKIKTLPILLCGCRRLNLNWKYPRMALNLVIGHLR